MRESFTYGSVGRAPRERCLYPEGRRRAGGRKNWLLFLTVRCARLHVAPEACRSLSKCV